VPFDKVVLYALFHTYALRDCYRLAIDFPGVYFPPLELWLTHTCNVWLWGEMRVIRSQDVQFLTSFEKPLFLKYTFLCENNTSIASLFFDFYHFDGLSSVFGSRISGIFLRLLVSCDLKVELWLCSTTMLLKFISYLGSERLISTHICISRNLFSPLETTGPRTR
jgi:hypothetical protein